MTSSRIGLVHPSLYQALSSSVVGRFIKDSQEPISYDHSHDRLCYAQNLSHCNAAIPSTPLSKKDFLQSDYTFFERCLGITSPSGNKIFIAVTQLYFFARIKVLLSLVTESIVFPANAPTYRSYSYALACTNFNLIGVLFGCWMRPVEMASYSDVIICPSLSIDNCRIKGTSLSFSCNQVRNSAMQCGDLEEALIQLIMRPIWFYSRSIL